MSVYDPPEVWEYDEPEDWSYYDYLDEDTIDDVIDGDYAFDEDVVYINDLAQYSDDEDED